MPKSKYTRRPDGRFEAKVWDGTYSDITGKKSYVALYSAKSSRELENIVSDFKASVKAGTYVRTSNITFRAYAREWLSIYKVSKSTNTRAMYNNIVEKHMLCLDLYKIGDVTRSDLQEAINSCTNSPRICQMLLLTIRQVVKAAVMDQLISRNDAAYLCDGLETPRYRPSEKRALKQEEQSAIKVSDFSLREKAFVWIIYGCGLRRGETLALNRADIDLKQNVIHVNKAIAFDGNVKEDKSTKNYVVRDVPMPAWLSPYLKEYLSTLPGMLLFTKLDGTPITKSSYDKMWAQIVRKMNYAAGGSEKLQVVYDLTAHVFRHNYCTQLCYSMANGKKISINKIAELLGDSREMVVKVYSHVLEEMEDVDASVNEAVSL